MTFKYFNIARTYNELYYQFPKLFIHGDTYKKLSNSAKIAYVLLKSELELAIHKKQFDDDGHIYFEFTISELCRLLNCSNKTVIKIKKELSEYNLLKEQQMGFNPKTKKNNNNRLYLSELEVTENDIYSMSISETLINSGSVESTPRQNKILENETLINSGSVKSTPRQNVDNSGSVKSTLIFNNKQDTLQDTLLDTGNSLIDLEQYAQQLESEIDNPISYSIPERAKQILMTFSQNNYKEVEQQIGMIFRAKKEVADKAATSLVIEYFEDDFINQTKIIALAIFKDKKDLRKIKNYDSYFYKSFVRYFEEQVNKQQQQNKDTDLPTIPLNY